MKVNTYLLILFIFLSCNAEKYPGFSQVDSSLYYQRVQLGDGIPYYPDSCFVDYSVSFYPYGNKELEINKSIKFAQIPIGLLKDSLLKDPKEGDLIRFVTSKHEVYLNELCRTDLVNDSLPYFIEFHIDKIYNLYVQKEDPNVKEYKSIEHFFTFSADKDDYQYYNGIWLRLLSRKDDSTTTLSGEIVLDYRGYSLKEDEWDIPDFPLKFNLEDRFQVIRGIELALQNMHYNDSVEVIIPSYLAFGELGSKNGNIPPYQALKYYLKVYQPEEYARTHPNLRLPIE